MDTLLMENLIDILKNAPEGIELYSPLFGYGKLNSVDDINCNTITVIDGEGDTYFFDTYGRLKKNPMYKEGKGDCMLFPADEDYGDLHWDNWQDVLFPKCSGACVVDCDGNLFILKDDTIVENIDGKRSDLSGNYIYYDDFADEWQFAPKELIEKYKDKVSYLQKQIKDKQEVKKILQKEIKAIIQKVLKD